MDLERTRVGVAPRGTGSRNSKSTCPCPCHLSERTVADAAAKAGVNEKTLRRWLSEDEAFQANYAAARQAAFEVSIHRVQALTGQAVDTLAELLGEKKYPNVRLGAARTVAEIGIHQHDAETILRKLDEIETQQRQEQGHGNR